MNFARDVVDAAPPARRALVALGRDGARAEWSFGEVADASARAAGALAARGVGRGDVVMTLVGNRPEWVLTMLACFRLGAVALPVHRAAARGGPALAAGDRAAAADRVRRAQPRRAGRGGAGRGRAGRARAGADRRRAAGRRRARARGPVPRDVHLRHVGRAEGGAARPALPDRPGGAGRALARAGARAAVVVHGRLRLVEVGPQRVHRPVAARRGGAAARRALRPPRAARHPRRRGRSTRSAWRRPSTA